MTELVLNPTIFHDVVKASLRHTDFLQNTSNDTLHIDGWWRSIWGPIKLPAVKHGTTHVDHGAKSQHLRESYLTSKASAECVGLRENEKVLCSSIPLKDVVDLCKVGQLDEALEVVTRITHHGISIPTDTFISLLLRCIDDRNLAAGREVHDLIMSNGLGADSLLGSHLIHMFVLFDRLFEANLVFSRLFQPGVFLWSAIILANVHLGQNGQAVNLYCEMQKSNVKPSGQIFVTVLKACSNMEIIEQGKWVHGHIIESGLESDPYVGCTLIDMYVKCGSLREAHCAFDTLPIKPVETWNALIAGYTDCGSGHEGLKLFKRMQQEGIKASRVTFICVLKACSSTEDLQQGRQIHAFLIESGFEFGIYVGNTLIDMYVKCESLEDGRTVFCRSSRLDVVTCNTLVAGYAQHGCLQEALCLLKQMKDMGIELDQITFVCILKACCSIETLEQGRQIHAKVIESGLGLDELVGNSLMHMYTCCESLEDACVLFDKLPERNVVTWSTLIAGYAQNGRGQEALELFGQMRHQGIAPNQVTFISLLKACSNITALEKGRLIHTDVIEGGFERVTYVGNALIDMYGKCGSLEDASITFHRLSTRDVVTWTALIAGYSQLGHDQEALLLFETMQNEGMKPNPVTFASLLKAYSDKEAIHQGRWVHACSIESGLEFDAYVSSSLIDMYSECCCLQDARTVFNRLPQRGVVMWNTLMAGHVQHGKCLEAVQCYQQMQVEGVVHPDAVTYVCILKACFNTAALEQGIWVHAHIIGSSFSTDTCVGSVLIDMYVKCGCLEDACRVFNSLPKWNIVTWNTLMGGYAEGGHGRKTLQLFWQMQVEGMEPDSVTFLCTIKACSSMAALQQGRLIHMHSIKWGRDSDLSVGNTLIDMYASCGSLSEAHAVFDHLPVRDIVSWSALMVGYAQHSDYSGTLRCYEGMQQSGFKPDKVMFICLLSACSHGGFVDEGCLHFKSMRENLGIRPTVEHYNPVVDLLGHVGFLQEAEDLLETAPFQKNIVGWASLMHSCRTYSNLDIGRRCFDHVVAIDHANAAGYVLMSNIYTRAGQWGEAHKLEELRKLANAWKKPAKAFIEIDSQVHEFMVGDRMHQQSDDIYTKLKALNTQLRKEGYRPHVDLVLNLSLDEDKENVLCGHSEKLAIAFGLISTSPATTLRVAKNLRMCADCHVATKLISKIEMRDIVVKDAYCIHQFQKGLCSCKE